MSFGIHPFVLMAAISVLLAFVALAAAWWVRRGVVKATMIALTGILLIPAACVFLAFDPELVDGRFRTYKAFYRDIQIGMTRDQVFALLDRHYPKSGPRRRPKVVQDEPDRLGFFMDPETSPEPNCEGIFLTLDEGRVERKVYLPD